MKKNKLFALFILSRLILFTSNLSAQEKEAKIELSFSKDSVKTCMAKVTSGDSAVKEIELKFYVQRLFSLLPVGVGVSTDENGMAEIIFPDNLPGDSAGNLTVIAKIEEDDTYGTVSSQAVINWGLPPVLHEGEWNGRSLSASREKAPLYLIIVSIGTIVGVWGTLGYIVVILFRIKKNSSINKS